MRSPPRPSFNPRPRRRRSTPATGVVLGIDQLERRFAKFRREHPPQTRIPVALRGAVLAAMRQGVTPAQLRRSCGLSSSQLQYWQQDRGAIQTETELAMQAPRILSVVDDVPPPDRDPAGGGAEQQIELRLNGWSICVRRVDR